MGLCEVHTYNKTSSVTVGNNEKLLTLFLPGIRIWASELIKTSLSNGTRKIRHLLSKPPRDDQTQISLKRGGVTFRCDMIGPCLIFNRSDWTLSKSKCTDLWSLVLSIKEIIDFLLRFEGPGFEPTSLQVRDPAQRVRRWPAHPELQGQPGQPPSPAGIVSVHRDAWTSFEKPS